MADEVVDSFRLWSSLVSNFVQNPLGHRTYADSQHYFFLEKEIIMSMQRRLPKQLVKWSALARQSRAVLSAGLILAFSSNAALSAENCQRLEALANQYAGVELTSAQQQLKRKLVAWYARNCVRDARR